MNGDEGEPARKWRLRLKLGLGEVVALSGVVIAGLGLYFSHADHERDLQQAALEAQQREQVQSVLILRGEGGGGRIRLTPANGEQVVQSQMFYFPSAVRADAVHITGDGHLDAHWFADGLKNALHGSADDGSEQNLPVGIFTTFVENGQVKADASLYQLGYTIHPRFLQGAEVRIEGIALGRRAVSGALQGAVDGVWASQAPAVAKP